MKRADDTTPLRNVTGETVVVRPGHIHHRRRKQGGGQRSASKPPQSGATRRSGEARRRSGCARASLGDPPQLGRQVARRLPAISGSLVRQRRTRRSSETGVRGCSDDSDGGSAATIAAMSEARLSPENGAVRRSSRRGRRRTRRCRCERPPRALRFARAPCREPSR